MNEIDTLRATITGLSLAVPRWIDDLNGEDPVALLLLLDDLRALRQELASVEAYAESQAGRAMTARRATLPDGRVATRYANSKRTDWQHGRILTALWHRAEAAACGDYDAAAAHFRDLVVRNAGITYWRQSVGLDLDEYSTVERGRHSIRIDSKPSGGEHGAA